MDESLIHLDTSFAIEALHDGSSENAQIYRWMSQGIRLGMSVVAWAEFLCGPIKTSHPEIIRRAVGEPEPLLAIDAKLAAEFFNAAGRRRGHLSDCMIAATAVRLGAALATTNPRDFQRMSGLVVNPGA